MLKLLKDRFNLTPTQDEQTISEQTIDAASIFESQAVNRLKWQDLDQALSRRLAMNSNAQPDAELAENGVLESMLVRGLVWRNPDTGEYFGTAAGIVLLAQDPSAVYPQCRFLVDAYRGIEPDGEPIDQEDIRGPMTVAIDRVMDFIGRNTRHPMKVIGLNRVRIDEYPAETLREAIVNAVAHRNYEDAGRKTMVEVFHDRIVVSSPGLPPKPISLQKLRSGRYKPCSRNPVIAQCLSCFHRIEERGSGIKRMRSSMVDHGLEEPVLAEESGYFQVNFKGPGKKISRLKAGGAATRPFIPASVEQQLNSRRKKIVAHALREGSVSTSWVVDTLKIAKDTARRDFNFLVEQGILSQVGEGRSTHYVLKERNGKNDR